MTSSADPPAGDIADPPAGDIAGLRFKVTELRRRPGSRSAERRVVDPNPPEDARSLSIGEARVASAPVTVDVDIESLNDGVRVRATVTYAWEGSCRRCLGVASGMARSEILELFVDDPVAYEASAGGFHPDSGADDTDGDVHKLDNGWVDLSDSVRDALLLGLPLAPLCADDCAGPSPGEFPVELPSEHESTAHVSAPDPRWAALDELRFDPEGT